MLNFKKLQENHNISVRRMGQVIKTDVTLETLARSPKIYLLDLYQHRKADEEKRKS